MRLDTTTRRLTALSSAETTVSLREANAPIWRARQDAAVHFWPTSIAMPSKELTTTNPASSVPSSPAKIGIQREKGGSSRNGLIALPLSV